MIRSALTFQTFPITCARYQLSALSHIRVLFVLRMKIVGLARTARAPSSAPRRIRAIPNSPSSAPATPRNPRSRRAALKRHAPRLRFSRQNVAWIDAKIRRRQRQHKALRFAGRKKKRRQSRPALSASQPAPSRPRMKLAKNSQSRTPTESCIPCWNSSTTNPYFQDRPPLKLKPPRHEAGVS